jgi:hypothetical protein
MILVQVYKTFEGARKRAGFESAHSKTHWFKTVRFLDGKRDDSRTIDNFAWGAGLYTWRVEKTKRES